MDIVGNTLADLKLYYYFFFIATKQLEQEKSSLLIQIQEIEKEHKQTVLRLQHYVEEKEKALAAEFAEAEQVYKTNEHDLRERLDEKAQIIEVLYSNFLKQVPHVYLLGT